MNSLDADLLTAHAAGDRAALTTLYTRAADQADDVDATCFFLTQAMVFALEAGDPRAETLRHRLIGRGREVP